MENKTKIEITKQGTIPKMHLLYCHIKMRLIYFMKLSEVMLDKLEGKAFQLRIMFTKNEYLQQFILDALYCTLKHDLLE